MYQQFKLVWIRRSYVLPQQKRMLNQPLTKAHTLLGDQFMRMKCNFSHDPIKHGPCKTIQHPIQSMGLPFIKSKSQIESFLIFVMIS